MVSKWIRSSHSPDRWRNQASPFLKTDAGKQNKNKRKSQWWTWSYAPSVKYCHCLLLERMVTQPGPPPLCDSAGTTEKPQLQPCATCQQLTKTTHTSERGTSHPWAQDWLREGGRHWDIIQRLGRRWKFTFSNYLELLCDWNCAIRTHCLYFGVSPSNKLSLNLLMQSTNQYKKERNGKFS